MSNWRNTRRWTPIATAICLAAVTAAFTACGGGGGDDGGTDPGTTPGGGTVSGNLQGVMAVDTIDAVHGGLVVVDLHSGQRHRLPASTAFTQAHSSDHWSKTWSPTTIARIDANGVVDLLDVNSGQRTGGFALSQLPQTNSPSLWTDPVLSADGRHLLAYWLPDAFASSPDLVAFDTQGQVASDGSPLNYDSRANGVSIDWLPDGRMVYLAGPQIVAQDLSGHASVVGQLTLPSNVTTNNASISVSPDGSQIALSMATTLTSSTTGMDGSFRLIYAANLDGSHLRQLTTVSDRVRNGGLNVQQIEPIWSPNGQSIAFVPSLGDAAGAIFPGTGCPNITVVQANATVPLVVDAVSDPDTMHALVPNGSGTLAPLSGCYLYRWLAS